MLVEMIKEAFIYLFIDFKYILGGKQTILCRESHDSYFQKGYELSETGKIF